MGNVSGRAVVNIEGCDKDPESDQRGARIEHDKALQRVVTDLLADHAAFQPVQRQPVIRKWLADTIFGRDIWAMCAVAC